MKLARQQVSPHRAEGAGCIPVWLCHSLHRQLIALVWFALMYQHVRQEGNYSGLTREITRKDHTHTTNQLEVSNSDTLAVDMKAMTKLWRERFKKNSKSRLSSLLHFSSVNLATFQATCFCIQYFFLANMLWSTENSQIRLVILTVEYLQPSCRCIHLFITLPFKSQCNMWWWHNESLLLYGLALQAVHNFYGAVSFAPVDPVGHQATVGAVWSHWRHQSDLGSHHAVEHGQLSCDALHTLAYRKLHAADVAAARITCRDFIILTFWK